MKKLNVLKIDHPHRNESLQDPFPYVWHLHMDEVNTTRNWNTRMVGEVPILEGKWAVFFDVANELTIGSIDPDLTLFWKVGYLDAVI